MGGNVLTTPAEVLTGPVFRYAGAKWRLARWIISHFPAHETYVEPFLGSGCVFFQKSPSRSEYLGDADRRIVEFFRVARSQPEELAHAVDLTPYSRAEYEEAMSMPLDEDEIERVRTWLVAQQMSYGGNGHARAKIGWRHNGRDSGHGGVIRQWNNLPERIRQAAVRLKHAQVECRDGVDLIKLLNGSEVLIYADPPYLGSTRGRQGERGALYQHEMMDEDNHIRLLTALNDHPGMVILSGYASELYEDHLSHWHRVTRTAAAEGGQPREEVLWINPAATGRLADERAAQQRRAVQEQIPLFGDRL